MADRMRRGRGAAARWILYVQYTDPSAYPPLHHSARLLSDAGYRVLFLGTRRAHGAVPPSLPDSRIRVRQVPYCPPGWRQKVHYGAFVLWALAWGVRCRPRWVYASDPLASPIALLLRLLLGLRVVYHEHDSPGERRRASPFMRIIARARSTLAQRAELCVLPNQQRAARFTTETRCGPRVITVWNCPLRSEVDVARAPATRPGLVLYYHGNISPDLLPVAVLDAMAKSVRPVWLRVVGYETPGHEGYVMRLRHEADRLELGDRVEFLPPRPRSELLGSAEGCDVGLALVPMRSEDVNLRMLAGASNKAFEYLARGLALLVSDLPDWRRMYVDPGYAVACNPGDPESIAAALRWFADNRETMQRMGGSGRRRIAAEWNYETQFRPVFEEITRM